jgi:formylglycine-generating enzyme required for sulfatase activity
MTKIVVKVGSTLVLLTSLFGCGGEKPKEAASNEIVSDPARLRADLDGTGAKVKERTDATRAELEAETKHTIVAEGAKDIARKIGDTMTDKLGMKFAWVPPGECTLRGGVESNASDHRRFTLAKGLWCGVYEVTQAEWKKVMGNTPSYFKDNPRYPVESVSWYQVLKFAEKMNGEWKTAGLVYRLPSEDEWEYICRGGPTCRSEWCDFYFARSKTDLTPEATSELSPVQARFLQSDSATEGPREVGSYVPNPLGIYDMHGNVSEWTSSSDRRDSFRRVTRGGSWRYTASCCTARYAMWPKPGDSHPDLGFRLLAVPSE